MSRHKANRAEVLTAFLRDTAEHKMEVVLDQGLHRHLKFRKPGTGCHGFDIVTWPGYLAISGDMGAAMFTRLPDMLEFFRDKPDRHDAGGGLYINCGYWAEKCVANDGEKKEFDTDLFRECVKARFDEYVEEHTEEGEAPPAWAAELWEEIEQDVLLTTEDHESTFFAIKNMDEFKPDGAEYEGFRFSDAWESSNSLEDYRYHFIWRLYAIAYAVKYYDAFKALSPPCGGCQIWGGDPKLGNDGKCFTCDRTREEIIKAHGACEFVPRYNATPQPKQDAAEQVVPT